MNLPNSLTVARIFLVPILVSVLLTKFEGRLVMGLPVELVAAAIFGIASLTDWLDGKHTVFGKVTKGQDVVDATKQGDTLTSVVIAEE